MGGRGLQGASVGRLAGQCGHLLCGTIVLRLEEEEERGWLLLGPGWRGCKRRVDFAEYFMSGEICTHVQSYALG